MHVRRNQAGKVTPVIITVYKDKSFDFIIKTPPVAVQLLEVTKQKSGSAEPNRKKVGSVTWDQVREIAEGKMADLNCFHNRISHENGCWYCPKYGYYRSR